jgi:cyclohexanone monooxygenase
MSDVIDPGQEAVEAERVPEHPVHDGRGLGFDPDALRARYLRERDRRIRTDGNEQYVEVKGRFAHYVDDPYIDRELDRPPLTDAVDVVIIGGGFGGQLAAARLHEAGIEDFRIIEKGGDFGGTWYWNRYPGAQCDVESYIYLPLLEEVGYLPKEKYSFAPEILKHARAIGEKYDLYRRALFQTEVVGVEWDDARSRWVVRTQRGDALRARFVILSNGPLNRPKLPGIPGVESFRGHAFHTSRWDYDYTGGDSDGNLTRLGDKVVGIIGTGATAVQCVPHLGQWAKHLYVFQRTPSSIDVRGNRPTDPAWAASLEPGWQKRRMENFNALVSGAIVEEDLVKDGWTDIIRNLLFLIADEKRKGGALSHETLSEKMEIADFQKMNQIRARAEELVRDPATAEALKPWYRQFCKRPCFHDDYLPTFNRPNVTLVDTEGRGVERITESAVVANGRSYPVDCLIFATGFEVGTSYSRRCGYELVGRDGSTLSDKWKDGVRTLHGLASHGFPNMFILANAQSGFTANFPHALDEQSKHVAFILKHVLDKGYGTVEVSDRAEEAWVQTIIENARLGLRFLEQCTPGYYNNEGRPGERSGQNTNYGAGSIPFFRLLEQWRASGEFAGLEFGPA